MPRKYILLVGILLPHHVKWRWEERGSSGNLPNIKSCDFVELLFLLPKVGHWHKTLLLFPPFLKQS